MHRPIERLTEVNGRYLTILETERLLAERLTQQRRLAISDALHRVESSVAIWATEQFHLAHPRFNAPPGSERFEKGVRDGQYILRFLAQSIREGTSEPLHRNVLSWYVGHLDPRSVSPRDIERFLRLLQAGLHQHLDPACWPYCDLVLDEAVAHCRFAAPSGWLKRGQNQLAAWAMDWTMGMLPELGKQYGAATRIKGTRDFCFLIEEFGQLLHEADEERICENWVRWLVERLIPFVRFPPEVWRWSLLAILDAVVRHLPAVEGLRVARLLNRMAQSADRLVACNEIFDQADLWGELLISELADQFGRCGLRDAADFDKRIATACSSLVETLAVRWVVGDLASAGPRLSELWVWQILPMLPDHSPELAQAFRAALRRSLERDITDPLMRGLLDGLSLIDAVAAQTVEAQRLAQAADRLTGDALQACMGRIDTLGQWQTARLLYDDLRLLLARCALVLPLTPEAVQAGQLRAWLVDEFLAVGLPYSLDTFCPAVQMLDEVVRTHADRVDAASISHLLGATLDCIRDYRAAQASLPMPATINPLLHRQLLRTLAINTSEVRGELTSWLREEVLSADESERRQLLDTLNALATALPTTDHPDEPGSLAHLLALLRATARQTLTALELLHQSHTLADSATRTAWKLSQSGRGRKSTHAVEPFVQDVTCMLQQIALELLEPMPDPLQVQHWVHQHLSERMRIWPLHMLRYLREQLPQCVRQAIGSESYESAAPLINWALN